MVVAVIISLEELLQKIDMAIMVVPEIVSHDKQLKQTVKVTMLPSMIVSLDEVL